MKKHLTLLLLSSLLIAFSPSQVNIQNNLLAQKRPSQYKSMPTSSHKRTIQEMIQGNVTRGESIFIRYLQSPCQLSASDFAAQHSQDEWEAIVQAGEFQAEVIKICPAIKGKYQSIWSPDLYEFAYTYANDTGNLPVS